MRNNEKFIRESHRKDHRTVSDPGEIKLDADTFAPDGIRPHLTQPLPVPALSGVYGILDYVRERDLKKLQSQVEEALQNIDPANPEEYRRPQTNKPEIKIVDNGNGIIFPVARKPKNPRKPAA